ncbi:MAG: hypothetical protein ACK56I_19845, partial [bacterium]
MDSGRTCCILHWPLLPHHPSAHNKPWTSLAGLGCRISLCRLWHRPEVRPNPSLKLTRYGKHCKPGLR